VFDDVAHLSICDQDETDQLGLSHELLSSRFEVLVGYPAGEIEGGRVDSHVFNKSYCDCMFGIKVKNGQGDVNDEVTSRVVSWTQDASSFGVVPLSLQHRRRLVDVAGVIVAMVLVRIQKKLKLENEAQNRNSSKHKLLRNIDSCQV
jgi:hypothetical protein